MGTSWLGNPQEGLAYGPVGVRSLCQKRIAALVTSSLLISLSVDAKLSYELLLYRFLNLLLA